MRGRCKRKEPRKPSGAPEVGAGASDPPPRGAAAGSAEADSPVPGLAVQDEHGGSRCSLYDGEKVYVGVRVKMPVRDLLRNIRRVNGCGTQDFEETCSKTTKGVQKRVRTRRACRTSRKIHPTKSLEELAIIIEVLEEDLRTCSPLSSSSSPPDWSPSGADYNSDSDEMIPSPPPHMKLSPTHTSLQPSGFPNRWREKQEWFDPQIHDWNHNSSAFFWTQLQKEEAYLRDFSDTALLAADEHGRTVLHKVASVGKRALGYAIAKRMAALNGLDLKDSDGMTALLYAAEHNHHLIVADLICLGANVNETNSSGKSCLHLSAEKGYFRVLEVLKHTMMDGVYVDVEATDNSGMSVLQCASLALKAAVREQESGKSSSHATLRALHREQMMETLECLLQMGSYLHTMGSQAVRLRLG